MLKKASDRGSLQEENQSLVSYLKPRQKAAYEAARSAGVKVAIIKKDVVLDGLELYESRDSAELSHSGKEKLKRILVATNALEERKTGKVVQISPIYANNVDLAKKRAQKLGGVFNHLVLNAVFEKTKAYKELYEVFPKDSERLIVIRQHRQCLCCRFILPLLLILLICLGSHFLETMAKFIYTKLFDEFGEKNFVIDVPANNLIS